MLGRKSATTQVERKTTGTKDLFLETLKNVGCQYHLDETDDSMVYFDYQGEHFAAETANDNRYVFLWDTFWEQVELYDIDEVSRLRKAINSSNIKTSVTTVFSINEGGKTMDVHSRRVIPFLNTMPCLEDYLRAELSGFFYAHQLVGAEMHKLREQEKNA